MGNNISSASTTSTAAAASTAAIASAEGDNNNDRTAASAFAVSVTTTRKQRRNAKKRARKQKLKKKKKFAKAHVAPAAAAEAATTTLSGSSDIDEQQQQGNGGGGPLLVDDCLLNILANMNVLDLIQLKKKCINKAFNRQITEAIMLKCKKKKVIETVDELLNIGHMFHNIKYKPYCHNAIYEEVRRKCHLYGEGEEQQRREDAEYIATTYGWIINDESPNFVNHWIYLEKSGGGYYGDNVMLDVNIVLNKEGTFFEPEFALSSSSSDVKLMQSNYRFWLLENIGYYAKNLFLLIHFFLLIVALMSMMSINLILFLILMSINRDSNLENRIARLGNLILMILFVQLPINLLLKLPVDWWWECSGWRKKKHMGMKKKSFDCTELNIFFVCVVSVEILLVLFIPFSSH